MPQVRAGGRAANRNSSCRQVNDAEREIAFAARAFFRSARFLGTRAPARPAPRAVGRAISRDRSGERDRAARRRAARARLGEFALVGAVRAPPASAARDPFRALVLRAAAP